MPRSGQPAIKRNRAAARIPVSVLAGMLRCCMTGPVQPELSKLRERNQCTDQHRTNGERLELIRYGLVLNHAETIAQRRICLKDHARVRWSGFACFSRFTFL